MYETLSKKSLKGLSLEQLKGIENKFVEIFEIMG